MKILTSIALLVMATALFAAGSEKVVDGITFVKTDGVWIEKGLDLEMVSETNSVVRGDARWTKWNAEGTKLSKVLALGGNVVFKATGRDGQQHIYSVFEDQTALRNATAGTNTRSLLGAAVLAGSAVARGEGGGSPSTP